jgi:methionyl-tRNA formyltransferase
MAQRKLIRSFLFTGYTTNSYEVIDSLLANGCDLAGVLFAPSDRKRLGIRTYIKNILTYNTLRDPAHLLRKKGIPYAFTNDHNGSDSEQMLCNSQADVLLLYGTKIIKPHILSLPKIGVLNSHSALLPKYRGGKSEFWILYNNEPEYAGVTIHWVVPGLDEGDIFLQHPIEVEKKETPSTLRKKSVPVTAKLFVEAIQKIEQGGIIRIPQDSALATKYKYPTSEQIREFEKRYEYGKR